MSFESTRVTEGKNLMQVDEDILRARAMRYVGAIWEVTHNSVFGALVNNKLTPSDIMEVRVGDKLNTKFTWQHQMFTPTVPIASTEDPNGKAIKAGYLIQEEMYKTRYGINESETRELANRFGISAETSLSTAYTMAIAGNALIKQQYIIDKLWGICEDSGKIIHQTHLDLTDVDKIADFGDGVFGLGTWDEIYNILISGINPVEDDFKKTRMPILPFSNGKYKVLMDTMAFGIVQHDPTRDYRNMMANTRGLQNPVFNRNVDAYHTFDFYNVGLAQVFPKNDQQTTMILPFIDSLVIATGFRQYDKGNGVVTGHPNFAPTADNLISRIVIMGRGAMGLIKDPTSKLVVKGENFDRYSQLNHQDAFSAFRIRPNPALMPDHTPLYEDLIADQDTGIMTIDICVPAVRAVRKNDGSALDADGNTLVIRGSARRGLHVPSYDISQSSRSLNAIPTPPRELVSSQVGVEPLSHVSKAPTMTTSSTPKATRATKATKATKTTGGSNDNS